MKKYLELSKIMIKANYHSLKIYKTDFIIGNIIFLISNIITLLVTLLMFGNQKSIHGFNVINIMILQCYYQLSFSIVNTFFDNLWNIAGREVKNGDYDAYLVKPINSLYYASTKIIDFKSIGSACINLILLIVLNQLSKDNINILLLILQIPFTVIIIYSIEIIVTSTVFRFKKVRSILSLFIKFSQFSKYPLNLFPRILQVIMIFIVPFASALYLPVKISMGCYYLILFLIVISVLLFLIAKYIWEKEEMKYNGSGN